MAEIKAKSRDLKARLTQDKELSESARVRFYSKWHYCAIRLATSIAGLQTPDKLAAYFNLPLAEIHKITEFLLEHGLCLQTKDSRIVMGPKRTHIEADSPLAGRHHINWRIKAMSKIDRPDSEELFFTAPMALSVQMVEEVRKDLVRLIERLSEKIVQSESETMACLNMDWFKL